MGVLIVDFTRNNMTKIEWLDYARDNKDKLLSLVALYHPTSNQRPELPITAPTVEANCKGVRKRICREFLEIHSAAKLFGDAIAASNVDQIHNLLSQTWFGVPESTACWGVTGFKECVNLLDDPPEDD